MTATAVARAEARVKAWMTATALAMAVVMAVARAAGAGMGDNGCNGCSKGVMLTARDALACLPTDDDDKEAQFGLV